MCQKLTAPQKLTCATLISSYSLVVEEDEKLWIKPGLNSALLHTAVTEREPLSSTTHKETDIQNKIRFLLSVKEL